MLLRARMSQNLAEFAAQLPAAHPAHAVDTTGALVPSAHKCLLPEPLTTRQ